MHAPDLTRIHQAEQSERHDRLVRRIEQAGFDPAPDALALRTDAALRAFIAPPPVRSFQEECAHLQAMGFGNYARHHLLDT